MALQNSGAISLNEIHIEAGGTTGTSVTLNDSDVRDLISAVSESEMSFDDWYGASADSINLVACSASDLAFGGQSVASLTIESDGEVSGTGNLAVSVTDWWSAAPEAGLGDDYEVKATVSSGSNPSTGTVGSWQALSSNRAWSLRQVTNGSSSSSLLIQIRDTATQTIQDSATWTLSVQLSSGI